MIASFNPLVILNSSIMTAKCSYFLKVEIGTEWSRACADAQGKKKNEGWFGVSVRVFWGLLFFLAGFIVDNLDTLQIPWLVICE